MAASEDEARQFAAAFRAMLEWVHSPGAVGDGGNEVVRLVRDWLGPDGLAAIAQRAHRRAAEIAAGLRAGGVEVVHDAFFDTVLARVPGRAAEVVAAARERGINLRHADADHVGVSCDERTVPEHVTAVLEAFGVPAGGAGEQGVGELGHELGAQMGARFIEQQHGGAAVGARQGAG